MTKKWSSEFLLGKIELFLENLIFFRMKSNISVTGSHDPLQTSNQIDAADRHHASCPRPSLDLMGRRLEPGLLVSLCCVLLLNPYTLDPELTFSFACDPISLRGVVFSKQSTSLRSLLLCLSICLYVTLSACLVISLRKDLRPAYQQLR